MTQYRRDMLVSTLIYHQRTDKSGCICGWGKLPEHLGRFHADHVADVYEVAVVEAAGICPTCVSVLSAYRWCPRCHRHVEETS